MKKIFIFSILLISIKSFSQQVIPMMSNEVKRGDTIYESVDKQPEYPGGINVFRKKFSEGIKSNKIIGKGFLSAEAQFVIGKDGFITDIRVKGENYSLNEEIRSALNRVAKTKWSPAEINGSPVRYKFRLPVKMNIQ
jgi:protein TonB